MSVDVATFRENYRNTQIPAGYSGWMHFCFTSSVAIGTIALAIAKLHHVAWWEWLAAPLTFLFANLVEYIGHRGPMHHPVRGLRLLYQRHSLEHHRFFNHQVMGGDTSRDFKMVLFPPVMIIFFIGLQAVPIGLLLYYAVSPNVAALFVAVALGYFLTYEWLHFSYHVPESWPLARIGVIRILRELHRSHHDPALMTRANFNITFPICDKIFGTLR